MSEKFTLTGGARIGMANASFPLANLSVDREILKINASIVGSLMFQSKDIISIEPYMYIPLIGQGIKINHRVENYNSKVIFWTFKDPNFVIEEIKKTGFLQNLNSKISATDLEIIKKQQNEGGFPIKKSVAIFYIVAWNLLFLSDFFQFFTLKSKMEGSPVGIGINMAIGLIFLSSILTIVSEKFRKIILKENKNFEDIKKSAYFIAFITGIMFITITAINLNK